MSKRRTTPPRPRPYTLLLHPALVHMDMGMDVGMDAGEYVIAAVSAVLFLR